MTPQPLVVVITSPRPGGVDYLTTTIAKLGPPPRGWLGLVASDGPLSSAASPLWCYSQLADAPRGARVAFWSAFKLARKLNADPILVLEDDIEPAPGALELMAEQEIPAELAFVSFYNGRARVPPLFRVPYVHRMPFLGVDGHGMWGSLAMLMPAPTVDYLLEHDPTTVKLPAGFALNARSSADQVIVHLLSRRAQRWQGYGLRIPCLVDHRGDVSCDASGRPKRRGSNLR